MAQIIQWTPWEYAPRDGRWIIARSNDGVTLHRVSWGVSSKGYNGWCSADGYFGDQTFTPLGWIEWPADSSYAGTKEKP